MAMANVYLIEHIVLGIERRYHPAPCAACWMISTPSFRSTVAAAGWTLDTGLDGDRVGMTR